MLLTAIAAVRSVAAAERVPVHLERVRLRVQLSGLVPAHRAGIRRLLPRAGHHRAEIRQLPQEMSLETLDCKALLQARLRCHIAPDLAIAR